MGTTIAQHDKTKRANKEAILASTHSKWVQHVSYHGTSQALSLTVLFEAQNSKIAVYR